MLESQLALKVVATIFRDTNGIEHNSSTVLDASLKKLLTQGPEDEILWSIERLLVSEYPAVLGCYASTYGEAGMLIQQKNRFILLKCTDVEYREGMIEFRRKQSSNAISPTQYLKMVQLKMLL